MTSLDKGMRTTKLHIAVVNAMMRKLLQVRQVPSDQNRHLKLKDPKNGFSLILPN